MQAISTKYGLAARVTVAVVLAGTATGVAAWVFKWLIKEVSTFVTSDFHVGGGNWWLIPAAVAGILLTGFVVRRIFKVGLDRATERLAQDVRTGSCRLSPRLIYSPVIASSLTLGFGGSAGSESPIAYTGAAIANNIGRLFGLNPRLLMMLLICGAGAGISAIFKSPLGGVFFAIEVMQLEVGVVSLSVLMSMCLLAAVVPMVLSDFAPDLSIAAVSSPDASMLPVLTLLGVLGGVYSVYYTMTGRYMAHTLYSIDNQVMANIVSGLLLGVMLFMFPSLYGEGYKVLEHLSCGDLVSVTNGTVLSMIIDSPLPLYALTGILLLKGFATYATNCGGGVAGDYAPTLFAGGVLGALAVILEGVMPQWCQVPGSMLVVCGMASVMTGVIRAPMMAIFITIEMTASPGLLIPVAYTSAVTLFTLGLFRKKIGA